MDITSATTGGAQLNGTIDVNIANAVDGALYTILHVMTTLVDNSTVVSHTPGVFFNKEYPDAQTLAICAVVPEPTFLGFAGLGAMALLKRRPARRKAG